MDRKRKSMNNLNTTSSTAAAAVTSYPSPVEPDERFGLGPPNIGTRVYSPSKTREISSNTVVKAGFHEPATNTCNERSDKPQLHYGIIQLQLQRKTQFP